jgi:hypothetical protein
LPFAGLIADMPNERWRLKAEASLLAKESRLRETKLSCRLRSVLLDEMNAGQTYKDTRALQWHPLNESPHGFHFHFRAHGSLI